MINIREARTESGLTQKQAAEKCGVPYRTYQNWENGYRKPTEYMKIIIIEKLEGANKMVKNMNGKEICFEAAVDMMDDEIREGLHTELAPCEDQEFFTAYEKAHAEKFGEEWELSKSNPVW